MRKNKHTASQANRKMSNDTYALRRNVMDVIYSIKRIVDLPRIDVRITDSRKAGVLGVARMSDNIIWITAEVAAGDKGLLTHVVAHEIGHAVFGLEHDDDCPLMKPTVNELHTAGIAQIGAALGG